jgi:hypothetical protein
MDVHVDFYDQPPSNGQPSGKKVASTHSRQTLSGNDAYSIVTDGTIAKLGMTVSSEYFSGASDFYVSLQPLDSAGNVIAMPGEVAIYAPSGSVTAAAAPKTSPPPIIADGIVADTSDGTARFHYTGAPLVNPVTVVGVAGTFSQTAWNAAHPGMIVSRYTLPVEDDNSMSGHDLNWWQSNHPDWILYACDPNNNPTKQLAWSTSYFPDVPLDFSNPQVVQFQINEIIAYLKANGYNTLAVDNTDLINYLHGGNPLFGQQLISGYYGCGTYDTSGNFHRVFGGPLNAADPAFISAMINWVRTVESALHNAGLKLVINHPLYNSPSNANEQQMLAATDAMVYERGLTDYGKYMSGEAYSLVTNAISWATAAQTHHVAFLVTDYLCSGWNGTAAWNNNGPCPSDPSQIPAPQADWALATYALLNLGGADVYISPQVGQMMSYRPEYSTTYGQPCGSYSVQNTYVFVRKFQGALVVVNTATSATSYPLPSGHTYRDIEGRAVSNPLSLGPADGYVLLTSNGCS